MKRGKVEQIVVETLIEYCEIQGIDAQIDVNTPLVGSNAILDSMGLVNYIVDMETAFLDEGVDVSLTSSSAMSGRISPFRSVSSITNFISKQIEENE